MIPAKAKPIKTIVFGIVLCKDNVERGIVSN